MASDQSGQPYSVKNTQVWNWFDQDQAVNALIGSGPFFLPEATWYDQHDRILVMDQLLAWAREHGQLESAAHAVHAALHQLAASGDFEGVLDLAHCYLIVTNDRGQRLPIDGSELRHDIDASLGLEGAGDRAAIVLEALRRYETTSTVGD